MGKNIILIYVLMILSGCSTMHIVKQCNQVSNTDDLYVCLNLKPWE